MLPPSFNENLGLPEIIEEYEVQQLVPKPPIEAIIISVRPYSARTPRCSWFDEQGLGADLGDPVPQSMGSELRAVIRSNVTGNAPLHHEVSQDGENALPVHATRKLVTRELVDHDGDHTELMPLPGAVLYEVISPCVVGTLGPEPYARTVIQPEPTALRLFLGNTKALPLKDPSNTLVVHMPAVAPEQCGNPPIAIATILAGKLNDRSR